MPHPSKFVLFDTDLFLAEQRDEDIDQWVLGGDCAGWIYMRLLDTPDLGEYSRGCGPCMEDWGWYFEVCHRDLPVICRLWRFFRDDSQPSWLIEIATYVPLLRTKMRDRLTARDRVSEAVANILTDPRFEKVKWYEQNPWEMKESDL